jgi:hypothetical protein
LIKFAAIALPIPPVPINPNVFISPPCAFSLVSHL